jgi:hypothetical protein
MVNRFQFSLSVSTCAATTWLMDESTPSGRAAPAGVVGVSVSAERSLLDLNMQSDDLLAAGLSLSLVPLFTST